MPRTYQVGFATIQVIGLFGATRDAFQNALEASWHAGASTARYGRRWLLSQRYEETDDRWRGRIGFVQEGELTTVVWDPETKDFTHGEAPSGVIVPFAVDLAERTVAYQLFAGQVRPGTFTGALQSLLNTQDAYSWLVSPLAFPMTFERWESTVQYVTEFSFRLIPPNPNYQDDDQIEALIENLRLGVARVSGKARQGETVNTNDSLFTQAMDHVRREYGAATVTGVDETGLLSEWKSSNGGMVPARSRIESESDEDEIPDDELLGSLQAVDDFADLAETESDEEEPSA